MTQVPRSAPAGARTNRRTLRLQRIALAAFLFLAAVLGLLRYIGVFGGNIREVVDHTFYRSAQLTGANLTDELKRDHIATVINLRGAEKTDWWWHDETARCRQLGVSHVDVALSATHLPPPDQLNTLVRALDHSRTPILIHCMGGADRAGLGSTLYLVLEQHQPLDKAEAAQLTWRDGHLSFSSARAMDWFFDLYRQTSDGLDMRHWIHDRYPALFKEKTQ